MRALAALLIVSPLALGLTACGDGDVRITTRDEGERGVLRVIDTLQCPDTQGVLTRRGAAQADGRICTYGGPRGAEVALHMVPLTAEDTIDEVLAAFEARLRVGSGVATAAPGAAATASGQAPPAVAVEAEQDKASVRLPGVAIDADGERADVRIGGFSFSARDSRADAAPGSASVAADDPTRDAVSVRAGADGSEVRTRASGPAVRATWVLASDAASPSGWRAVGYEARGPAGGPVVVATVRSRDRDTDPVFDAARALVTLNVGR